MAAFAAAYSFFGSGLQFRLTYVEIAGILGSWSSPKVGPGNLLIQQAILIHMVVSASGIYCRTSGWDYQEESRELTACSSLRLACVSSWVCSLLPVFRESVAWQEIYRQQFKQMNPKIMCRFLRMQMDPSLDALNGHTSSELSLPTAPVSMTFISKNGLDCLVHFSKCSWGSQAPRGTWEGCWGAGPVFD